MSYRQAGAASALGGGLENFGRQLMELSLRKRAEEQEAEQEAYRRSMVQKEMDYSLGQDKDASMDRLRAMHQAQNEAQARAAREAEDTKWKRSVELAEQLSGGFPGARIEGSELVPGEFDPLSTPDYRQGAATRQENVDRGFTPSGGRIPPPASREPAEPVGRPTLSQAMAIVRDMYTTRNDLGIETVSLSPEQQWELAQRMVRGEFVPPPEAPTEPPVGEDPGGTELPRRGVDWKGLVGKVGGLYGAAKSGRLLGGGSPPIGRGRAYAEEVPGTQTQQVPQPVLDPEAQDAIRQIEASGLPKAEKDRRIAEVKRRAVGGG